MKETNPCWPQLSDGNAEGGIGDIPGLLDPGTNFDFVLIAATEAAKLYNIPENPGSLSELFKQGFKRVSDRLSVKRVGQVVERGANVVHENSIVNAYHVTQTAGRKPEAVPAQKEPNATPRPPADPAGVSLPPASPSPSQGVQSSPKRGQPNIDIDRVKELLCRLDKSGWEIKSKSDPGSPFASDLVELNKLIHSLRAEFTPKRPARKKVPSEETLRGAQILNDDGSWDAMCTEILAKREPPVPRQKLATERDKLRRKVRKHLMTSDKGCATLARLNLARLQKRSSKKTGTTGSTSDFPPSLRLVS